MSSFADCITVIRGAPRPAVGAPRLVGALRHVVGAPRLVVGTPRFVVNAPRLVAGALRLVTGIPMCSKVHPKSYPALRAVLKLIPITPMVLLYQSSELAVTPKAGQNALPPSDTLLKLTHLSFHSTSSQTLLEASSD